MARPTIALTPLQITEVETLAALLSQELIADYFGIARNTFRAICDREPEVDARYKKGKAKAIAHVANGLLQKARAGDTVASIFYLKTQAGWRETTHLEHSGTMAVEDPSEGATQLQVFLDRIAERMRQSGENSETVNEPPMLGWTDAGS